MPNHPIQFQSSDLVGGDFPPVFDCDERGLWQLRVPDRVSHQIQFLSLQREKDLYGECYEHFSDGRPTGKLRGRGFLYSSGPDRDWFQRQLELHQVEKGEGLVVLYGDGYHRSLVTSAAILRSYFPVLFPQIDDNFIVPLARDWLLFAHHHGETWFVTTD